MTQFDTDTVMQALAGALQQNMSAEGENPLAPFGQQSQVLWTDWINAFKNGNANPNAVRVQVANKESTLGAVPSARMYTCSGLFGLCGPDDIIGLTMNDDPLVAWIGFFPDTLCERSIKAWVYFDQEGTAAGSLVGTVYGDACDDPPNTEDQSWEFIISEFGTLRACGNTVNVSEIGLRKCDKQPTYTIPVEGVGPIRINNDLDLETIAAGQTVKHTLTRLMVTGDASTNGQFDGLTNIVKEGYYDIKGNRITSADSRVVDWANDDLSGAVNGHGSIITKIRDLWRVLLWRIDQSSLGRPREGDVALVMPYWMSWEILDEWAFWSFREQTSANDQVVYRDAFELRAFRDRFNGGMFGAGFIVIDGFKIHILPHDWMAVSQDAPNFCTDIYLLVRQLGTKRVIQGQYIPADAGVNAVAAAAGFRYFNIQPIQGGRGLRWLKYQNACVSPCVLFRPRLFISAPWAQGVIQNVCVSIQFDPMSPDPQSSYFIEDTLVGREGRTQYWYGGAYSAGADGSWFH